MNEVQALMDKKLEAIKEKNFKKYMSTVTEKDCFYINEQKRWFSEMISEGMEDILFEVQDVLRRDDDVVAFIRQRHTYEDDFDVTYPLLMRTEDGVLKDCGYDFNIIEEEQFIIKYMTGDKRAWDFHEMIETAFKNVMEIFGRTPDFKVEIKLFNDRELLRQRTVPTIKWLFSGWGEHNESLKFYSGLDNIKNYQGLIQHELVHMITLDLCNGRGLSWVTEGIATRYSTGSYPFEDDIVMSKLDELDIKQTIHQLAEFDLYKESDLVRIGSFYASCYMYFDYLDKQYGLEKILYMFKWLGESNELNDNLATEKAVEEAFGITIQQLSLDYLNWLNV